MKETEVIERKRNFRELGGIPVKDGRIVAYGTLYRSGGLHLMREEEIEAVKALHIAQVMDFREYWSQKRKPDPDIGAQHIAYDGLPSKGGDKIDFSPAGFGRKGEEALAKIETVRKYYCDMPYGYDALRALFSVLKEGKKPVLFHCTKGKDRTGIAAILILLALGADRKTALQDYLKSNEYRKEEIVMRLAEGRSIAPDDEGYMTLMYLREGVLEDIGNQVIDTLYQRFGTIEAYLAEEHGWDENDLRAFRDAYLI